MVWLALSAALAALVLAALLLGQRRRLRALTESMEAVLRGGEPAPYSLKEDALAPLENAAAELEYRGALLEERLREERERGSRLAADLSHQLKTPLASLRLYCEMDASAHQAQQLRQIERMEKLIGDLLRLEKLSAGGYGFRFEEQSLRALAEAAWQPLQALWPDRVFSLEGDAPLRCDGRWLGEALQNLMKNACQHTGPGGRIAFRVEPGEHSVFCALEDDGGGVPEGELPRLFQRFYRAQGQSGEGSGLGLAIAAEIVRRHHGQARAENGPKGLRVTLSFPVLDLTKS